MADVPPPSTGYALGEIIAGAAAFATAASVGLMKLFERFKSTQRSATVVDAEMDVINGLRTELTRLAEQNGRLATSLNELQDEVVLLRRENASLHLTVSQLNNEIALLRSGR